MRMPRPDRPPLRIAAGSLYLEEFRAVRTTDLLEIRNHLSVRRGMRDPAPVPIANHQRFVEAHLGENPDMWLFLALRGERHGGMTLLRDFEGESAEIGVMFVEAHRHALDAYMAAHMTAWFGFDLLGLERLVSKVPLGNREALAFNTRCGFTAFRDNDDAYHYLVMEKARYRDDPTHRRFRARWPIHLVEPE